MSEREDERAGALVGDDELAARLHASYEACSPGAEARARMWAAVAARAQAAPAEAGAARPAHATPPAGAACASAPGRGAGPAPRRRVAAWKVALPVAAALALLAGVGVAALPRGNAAYDSVLSESVTPEVAASFEESASDADDAGALGTMAASPESSAGSAADAASEDALPAEDAVASSALQVEAGLDDLFSFADTIVIGHVTGTETGTAPAADGAEAPYRDTLVAVTSVLRGNVPPDGLRIRQVDDGTAPPVAIPAEGELLLFCYDASAGWPGTQGVYGVIAGDQGVLAAAPDGTFANTWFAQGITQAEAAGRALG